MDPDALVDAYAAAHLIGLPPATARSWARRGRLQRHGVDAEGRTLYRWRDLCALAAARKLPRGRSREARGPVGRA